MSQFPSRTPLKASRTLIAVGILVLLLLGTIGAKLLPRALGASRPSVSNSISSPAPAPSPCCGSPDDTPHLLMGSYYSIKDNLSARLLLNNKGSLPLIAHPTLFSTAGERFEVPPITIDPESFQMVDISDWVHTAGPQFEEGSIQVFHLGRDLVLGSQIYLVDSTHSLSFDEKLVEKSNFKSSRLEGLWWLPSADGEVRLALSNTSDSSLTTIVDVRGNLPNRHGNGEFVLNPHETRMLDIQADILRRPNGNIPRLGGISIQHSGAPGALLARGMVQEASEGYSLAIQFNDPATGKSTKLQGVGFRVGKAGDESLTPIVIARNVGNTATTLTGRFRYTKSDGTEGTVKLPQVTLSPGDLDDIDVAHAMRENGDQNLQATGSLEFEYSTAAGSVMMTALSVGGTQVFRVPMWDVYAQKSATGGYPWRIEGSSSTIVYIKNAEAHQQHYYFQLRYPGGLYSLGINPIEAGETVEFDVAKLRDQQIPDAKGRVIPLDATSGQIHWTKTGAEVGMLIGRSEQVDLDQGVSSNYACVNCCPDNAVNPRIRPNSQTNIVSGESQFTAEHQLTTCYGAVGDWVQPWAVQWQSRNEDIATVSVGLAKGVAPGTTTITAEWFEPRYVWTENDVGVGGVEGVGGGFCASNDMTHLSAQADFNVKPHATISEVGFSGDFHITQWSSGTEIDPNDNAPTWKSSQNPDLPAAYASGSTVTMFATLGIEPSVSNTSAKIRVKRGTDIMGTKDVTLSGTSTTITSITTTLALESTVKISSPTFTWEISYDGGNTWFPMGNSGPHKIYWTYGAPLSPPFQRSFNGVTDPALYDLALEKACGAANGSSDAATIVSRINNQVASETFYNPGFLLPGHPLGAYTHECLCADLASLLRGLIRSIGIDGPVQYIWAGPNSITTRLFIIGSIGDEGSFNPSFRIIRNSTDGARTNPHFAYHAVVSVGSTLYDPSYGLSYGTLVFDETAFTTTPQQTSTAFPPLVTQSGWTCPH